mgnify:FL=1
MTRPVAVLLLAALVGPARGELEVLEFPAAPAAEAAPAMALILLSEATDDAPVAAPAPNRTPEVPAQDAYATPAAAQAADVGSSPPAGVRAGLAVGLRQDRLLWHIAADMSGTATPNVLSELEWTQVRLLGINGHVDWPLAGSLDLGARMGVGFVVDGRNRDSDWLGDDRNNEFSRSYADVRGHGALDLALELAWRLPGREGSHLAPLLGYAWQSLHLNGRNGHQTIAPVTDDDGNYLGGTPVDADFTQTLDSTYEASWQGPYLGLAGELAAGAWRLSGRIERHHSDYRAEADWNLRDDFAHPVSFQHRGEGRGWRLATELEWRRADGLRFTLGLSGRRFRLDNGTDQIYFSDGSSSVTRLNQVKWRSAELQLGLRYAW